MIFPLPPLPYTRIHTLLPHPTRSSGGSFYNIKKDTRRRGSVRMGLGFVSTAAITDTWTPFLTDGITGLKGWWYPCRKCLPCPWNNRHTNRSIALIFTGCSYHIILIIHFFFLYFFLFFITTAPPEKRSRGTGTCHPNTDKWRILFPPLFEFCLRNKNNQFSAQE